MTICIVTNAQTASINFVMTKTYKAAAVDPSDISEDQKNTTVTYYDGLGRVIQRVEQKQSGNGTNLVTLMEYDSNGNQPLDYLPFPSTVTDLNFLDSAQQEEFNFYSTYGEITSHPYSQKFYEASPLNRVYKQAPPGDAWAGNPTSDFDHAVKYEYSTNSPDEVRLFSAHVDSDSSIEETLTDDGYYEENQLYKTITKDENWVSGKNHTTEEFKDKQGHLILKRTYNDEEYDTYYVYDQYGNLAYVIPPMAASESFPNAPVLNGLCYQYRYDYRNRMVEKKLPGKCWEYIVYDKLNRVILTGPSLNPYGSGESGWLCNKYDAYNRLICTGWFSDQCLSTENRLMAQASCDNQSLFSEQKLNSAFAPPSDPLAPIYYSDKVFPKDRFIVLSINYFDDYTFLNEPASFATSATGEQARFDNSIHYPRGLTTGSWTRVLTSPSETVGNSVYSLFNSKEQVIKSHELSYTGGIHDIETSYNFIGNPEFTVTTHKRIDASLPVVVRENFTYSEQDRVIDDQLQINNNPAERLASTDYDDLGKVQVKYVGGTVASNQPLQSIEYKYNVRGWLTAINKPETLGTDLFAFGINYDHISNDVYDQVDHLYNGNVSETSWRSAADNVLRRYGYQYDSLNRLRHAFYQKPEQAFQLTFSYNEDLVYDKNGNIIELGRAGDLDNQYDSLLIDHLEYAYKDDTNQLMKVTDTTNNPTGFTDDSNGTDDTADDYFYDDLGNMTKDDNKGITTIKYNHLNLPVQVLFNTNYKINYVYDGVGQKISKEVNAGTNHSTTLYLNGFQYIDNILQFFPHAEGYVKAIHANDDYFYSYVYSYKDHLGNIRMNYAFDYHDNVLKILEENEYYPFGLRHTNYNTDRKEHLREQGELKIAPIQPQRLEAYQYKYNGKEWQDELGLNMYDYGARNYDPAIGRWMNIDPLAEVSRRFSPYTYALNNPVYFIDPDGMMATPGDDLFIVGGEANAATSQLQSSTDMLTLSRNGKSGQISASQSQSGPLTESDSKLMDAISDTSINATVYAENRTTTFDKAGGKPGDPMVGGAFLGSSVSSDGTVNAEQLVNPQVLGTIDAHLKQPAGTSMKHETMEVYQGALDAPGARPANSAAGQAVYQPIHDKVVGMDSNFQNVPAQAVISKSGTGTTTSFNITNKAGKTINVSPSYKPKK